MNSDPTRWLEKLPILHHRWWHLWTLLTIPSMETVCPMEFKIHLHSTWRYTTLMNHGQLCVPTYLTALSITDAISRPSYMTQFLLTSTKTRWFNSVLILKAPVEYKVRQQRSGLSEKFVLVRLLLTGQRQSLKTKDLQAGTLTASMRLWLISSQQITPSLDFYSTLGMLSTCRHRNIATLLVMIAGRCALIQRLKGSVKALVTRPVDNCWTLLGMDCVV